MKPFNEFINNIYQDKRTRNPFYSDEADYNTNAPSYYDDLSRKTELIKILAHRIWEYDKELAKRFEEWDKNLEEFPEDVEKLLIEWMEDGTLDEIINDNIFNNLNDKIDAIKSITSELKDKDKSQDKIIESAPSVDFIWEPPIMKSNKLGKDGTPSTWNPEEHLDAFLNPLVDNDYVKKEIIGRDESDNYNVYTYTFEPKNYSRTILVTANIHGNETTGFFDLCQILPILVNNWDKYPQYAYIRHNVKLIVVPIVNPWGFAHQERENINNVDLNRNFDYNWASGKGTDPKKPNFKGCMPFSEKESQNIRKLVNNLDDVTAHVDLHDIVSVVNDYCIFYPRWANQENNHMSALIEKLRKKDDYLVWGSSTLSSLSNWLGIKENITSFLAEIYEGRAGEPKSASEMTRTVRWISNIIFTLSHMEKKQKSGTINDTFGKIFNYNDKYSLNDSSDLTLSPKQNEWQRIAMSQQRFKTIQNGIVELNGYLKFTNTIPVKIGINPNIAQNYHPYFSSGKSLTRGLFIIEKTYEPGEHYVPLYAMGGVQMSTTTESGVHRTNEIIPLIDMRKNANARIVINEINLIIKFTPTNSADSIQIMQSGESGNLKEETFKQIYPNTTIKNNVRNIINGDD